MTTEKERRFLVPDFWNIPPSPCATIEQGYLNLDPDRVVRVRRSVTNGWPGSNMGLREATVTVKGRKDSSGEGAEYEYPIPWDDAGEMLGMCIATVSKVRHMVAMGDNTVFMDVFGGPAEGVVIAEIEHGCETFVAPYGWQEVTQEPQRWSNVALATRKYL